MTLSATALILLMLTLPTPAVARCYIPVSVPHFKKADFARSQAETVCPPVHSIQLEPVAISPGWQVQRTWGHRRWRGTVGLRPGVRVPRHSISVFRPIGPRAFHRRRWR